MHQSGRITTLDDVLRFLDTTSLAATRKRDMVSAIKRVCEMAGISARRGFRRGTSPKGTAILKSDLPGHGITAKSFSNQKSFVFGARSFAVF